MPVRYLAFTPRAGGDFPDGVANGLEGGFHQVANVAARDAIATFRRASGMVAYCIAEAKFFQLGGDLTTWTEIRFVPNGGSDGQYLALSAGSPAWTTLNALPSGGASGKFLGYGASAAEWTDGYLVPTGGAEGQVVRLSAAGLPAWATPGMRRLPLVAGSFSTDVGGASSFSVATLQFRPSEVGFDVRTAEKVRFRAFASTTTASNKAIIELYAAGTLISTLETTSTSTAQCSVTSGSSDDVTAALSADKLLEVRVRLATDASATSSAFATIKSASLVVAA